MNCKGATRRWWGVGLLLAAVLTLRADVLVLKNGTLLLGRSVAAPADSVSLAVGSAGTITVRQSDIRQTIPCPSAEEPDSYFKAAQRASVAGWIAEAFACCDKSIATEPTNATAAQSLREALRQQSLAGARTVAQTAPPGQLLSDADRQRAEARRLIAEGEQQLRHWQIAANYDTKNRGSSALLLKQQGEASVKVAQSKIDQGKAMLEKLEKAAASSPPPPPPPSTSETITQWAWLIGVGAAGLGIVWFVLAPFISRR